LILGFVASNGFVYDESPSIIREAINTSELEKDENM